MTNTTNLSEIWFDAIDMTFNKFLENLINFQNTILTGFENCSDYLLDGIALMLSVQEMYMFDKIFLYSVVAVIALKMIPVVQETPVRVEVVQETPVDNSREQNDENDEALLFDLRRYTADPLPLRAGEWQNETPVIFQETSVQERQVDNPVIVQHNNIQEIEVPEVSSEIVNHILQQHLEQLNQLNVSISTDECLTNFNEHIKTHFRYETSPLKMMEDLMRAGQLTKRNGQPYAASSRKTFFNQTKIDRVHGRVGYNTQEYTNNEIYEYYRNAYGSGPNLFLNEEKNTLKFLYIATFVVSQHL